MPAADLVPGDVVKLTLGGVVAADVRIGDGAVQLDQSMLTGESMPVEAGAGYQAFAGALVRRGEAVAEVIATGATTRFGRTAELVRTAHVTSTQQKAVLRVVLYLAGINSTRAVLLIAYSWYHPSAARRDHSAGADRYPRLGPGRAARHFRAGNSDRRPGAGQARCAANPPVGSG